MLVRAPGSWRLQLWMQLAVWGRGRRCQHQSLERRHLRLQNIDLGAKRRSTEEKKERDKSLISEGKSITVTLFSDIKCVKSCQFVRHLASVEFRKHSAAMNGFK